LVLVVDGRPILMVGGLLSTVKLALGAVAGARFPAISLEVPAARVIPRAPLPLMALMVTVRVLPDPVTATAPVAVPVALRVISAGARVIAPRLVSL